MAMVNMSERTVSYEIPSAKHLKHSNSVSDIANLYTKASNYNNSIQSRVQSSHNHPPFNSICSRPSLVTNASVPGPGSYENIHQIMPKRPVSNIGDLQFFSKQPRFKPLEDIDDCPPGPGSYNITNNINNMNNKLLHLKNQKPRNKPSSAITVKFTPHSINNISTIPSKEHLYGYMFNEDGTLSVIEDPDKSERYSGRKNDCVGPGHYDPLFKREKNKMMSWDKMSPRGIEADPNMNNSNNNGPHNKSFDSLSLIENKETCNDSKIDVSSCIGSIEYNNKKIKENKKAFIDRKSLFQQILSQRNKLFHINTDKGFPTTVETQTSRTGDSVSYYGDNPHKIAYALNFNNLRYQRQAEAYQNFGSSSPKGGSYVIYDKDIKVGPGSYFKEKSKFQLKQSKSTPSYKSLSASYKESNNNTNGYQQELTKASTASSLMIGPGSYNIGGSLLKKSYSNIQQFSVGQKRFAEGPNDPKAPGPADYANQKEWTINKIKNDFKPRFVSLRNHNKEVIVERKKPNFYSYQPPNVINNIQTNVYSRINEAQAKLAPFASMEKRFRKPPGYAHLGPGKYMGDLIKPPENGMNYGFVSTERRPVPGTVSERERLIAGPGEYLRDNYFDWNKKSYNIMFI
jgi:hypothetical protein